MMDLDEAIQHCEEVADEKEEDAILYHNCATYKQNLYEKGLAENTEKECRACAEDHRQLADWLKELKAYREQSGDAISRQAVLDLIEHYNSDGLGSVFYGYDQGVKFAGAVNKLPSVSPQQRTGRWILHPNGIYAHLVCDKCLSCAPYDCKTNYCPNCGCKMREVEE